VSQLKNRPTEEDLVQEVLDRLDSCPDCHHPMSMHARRVEYFQGCRMPHDDFSTVICGCMKPGTGRVTTPDGTIRR
jgi:hypothetical protein